MLHFQEFWIEILPSVKKWLGGGHFPFFPLPDMMNNLMKYREFLHETFIIELSYR